MADLGVEFSEATMDEGNLAQPYIPYTPGIAACWGSEVAQGSLHSP